MDYPNITTPTTVTFSEQPVQPHAVTHATSSGLAFTGGDVFGLGVIGTVSILAGAVLLRLRRRPERDEVREESFGS